VVIVAIWGEVTPGTILINFFLRGYDSAVLFTSK